MKTQIASFLFRYRGFLQRFIPVRRPILLRLEDFAIYVRLTDWAVGARIAVLRTHEAHVTKAMGKVLLPGMVMVDIGANIGYYTLLAASRVGRSGKVIAFEPSIDNCALLRESLTANGFYQVEIHQLAVAEHNCIVSYHMDDSNGVIGSGDPNAGAYQVQAVALDDQLKDESQIDVIKMDIEGAEGRALAGMRRLLMKHRPVIFSEFSPQALQRNSGIAPDIYLRQLVELGYDLVVLYQDGHTSAPTHDALSIIQSCPQHSGSHLDLMAIPNDAASI